jgi:hypothetical protein
MLGGYHIFLRRMLIPIFIILIALLVWTITEPISSSLTRKVVTAIITGLSLGPVTNFDRGVAEWLRRRNKI